MVDHEERSIYAEQVRILYSQLPTAVVGGCVIGGLLTWILLDIANPLTLTLWAAALFTVLAYRAPWYFAFNKVQPDETAIRTWGRRYLWMTSLNALVWAAAPWLFIDPAQTEFALIIVLWIFGMSAASISAYAAHMQAMMAFILPVTLPTIVGLLVKPIPYGVQLALALSAYVVVVLRAAHPISRAMVDSIRLNLQMKSEIEERKIAHKKLSVMAKQDALTGLANRRHFDETLSKEIQRAEREHYPLSLILIDLDYFKSYNDNYGHLAGDNCLKLVSQTIKQLLKRPADLAARYGGEELALVLPHTNNQQAAELGESLRKAILTLSIPHTGSKISGISCVTISAGIATLDVNHPATSEALILLADERLYQAKADGRNRVVAG